MGNIYETLNDMQQMAVFHTEGPLLILAGAGSGKTRVLTHRIAYLMEEKHVSPYNIMAITFTNKAAAEMRNRVNKIVGFGAEQVWVSTFHSACVRILRRYIDRIGYSTDFTIYDTDDQKRLMKNVIKDLNLDSKIYKENGMLNKISDFKNKLMTTGDVSSMAKRDFRMLNVSKIYDNYQEALKNNNALDFDDLIMKTVQLFTKCPEVLESYQDRLRYIMVDEYQDTNAAQFAFVKLLAQKHQNLCVVGDDDQSIYKFRGADITNILQFEKYFPNARVIKLEQNYRSTKNILEAANAVIHNNEGRKDKTLWSDNEKGDKIDLYQAEDGYSEAEMVASTIKENVDNGRSDYSDYAILYRTNNQSRVLEEKLMMKNIPYKIIGGQNFYQRKEIKDIIAYLRVISNPTDDIAVERIINVPKRGIGATTVDKVKDYARAYGMDLYEALMDVENIPGLSRATVKIKKFTNLIEGYKKDEYYGEIEKLTKDILDDTGYVSELAAENTDEANGRIENIDELVSKIVEYQENAEDPVLSEFLEEVALVSEIDNLSEDSSYVVLMTVHSAKGLEFPYVFLCGMEDGLFPGYMSIMSGDNEELEEERRLCYVAITRAMKKLTISYAKKRMVRGEMQYNIVSRFVKEVPPMIVNSKNITDRVAAGYEKKPSFNGFGGYEGSVNMGGSGYMGSENYGGARSYAASQRKNAYKAMAAKPAYGNPSSKPGFGKEFVVTKAEIDYTVGDRVKHMKFGEGTVLGIEDGPRDYQVTVNFDTAGQKVMMASFAKLKKM
ncbi:DNA helicase PcrA [uncultured Eubacterium sp.]|uniref:DNA helicase PcrA n=1 Tax=uncultured Eubacterium sp. TaxID=165185 RepID=UPI002627B3FC|nr:DNA helicase PcrA [uncultured Eubacterium sp.]